MLQNGTFQLDSTTWGRDKRFSNFLSTIVNNSLNFIEIQPNFNAKWGLYSIIYGANLAEFEVGEGYLSVAKKKIQMTFGTSYLGNQWADSFQI